MYTSLHIYIYTCIAESPPQHIKQLKTTMPTRPQAPCAEWVEAVPAVDPEAASGGKPPDSAAGGDRGSVCFVRVL